MKQRLNLRCGVRTDPGLLRDHNEDKYFHQLEQGIFGVIDGVGGHNAGETAAAIAAQEIEARLLRPEGTIEEALREGITFANNKIFQTGYGRPGLEGMACVLSVAVVEAGRVTIGHVGDSRVYKLRNGRIVKLTHDHSPIGEREDRGELTELEAMRHLRRNEVYRDVGTEPHGTSDADFIEIVQEPFERDAALLLCSDGLTDLVTTGQILEVFQAHAGDPQQVADLLVEKALAEGGKDNVTVLVVEGPEFSRAGMRLREEGPTRRLGTAGEGMGKVIPLTPRTAAHDLESTLELTPPHGTPQPPPASQPPTPLRAVHPHAGAQPQIDAHPGHRPPVTPPHADRRDLPPRAPGWVLPIAGLSLAVVLIVAYLLWPEVEPPPDPPAPRVATDRPVVTVGPGRQHTTLREALESAVPGTVILVDPGRYPQEIALVADVRLVARVPGEVILDPPMSETPELERPVVSATGIDGASMLGFRIEAGGRRVGILVQDADVDLIDLQIEGATEATVRLEGTSRPILWNLTGTARSGRQIDVALPAQPAHLYSPERKPARPGEPAGDRPPAQPPRKNANGGDK